MDMLALHNTVYVHVKNPCPWTRYCRDILPPATNVMFNIRNISLAVLAVLVSPVAAVPNTQTSIWEVSVWTCVHKLIKNFHATFQYADGKSHDHPSMKMTAKFKESEHEYFGASQHVHH